LVADVLVVPFIASQFDTWGLERMDAIVGEVLHLNEKLRTIAFLNKVDTNPRIALVEEATNLATELKHLTFHKAITIGYRVAFRRSVADGMAVTELSKSKKDSKAIQEIINLYQEVFKDA
jgi:chromosome partitioning protein